MEDSEIIALYFARDEGAVDATSYGPYDPDTHAPSGYYDWYSAEFTLDGLNYEITAQRLTLEEVVAVAASVITGGTDFTVISVEAAAPDPPEASPTPGQEP